MATLKGTITRVNDERTVKVEVERLWKHPMYKKYVKRTKNYLVDVPKGMKLAVGDKVEITGCKPISKNKKFVVSGKQEA